MTQSKSENRKKPQGRRKPVVTQGGTTGGGMAVPVDELTGQLRLPFATAEDPAGSPVGVDRKATRHLCREAARPPPKAKCKEQKTLSATMEEVAQHLHEAFLNVLKNKGAPGPDRLTVEKVRQRWDILLPRLEAEVLEGRYRPGDVRRVWIPKSDGGQRGLGIPNVLDRVVSEAVRLVLDPIFEPTFSDHSHGFRPGRSCHTAIAAASEYLKEGYEYVVDLDLEKFFDRVSHQRLLARLAQTIQDRRLLVLIGQMLKACVVMPDGVKVHTEEGVPQGGPLSPLLSNIVLDELDQEFTRRGYRFVRYADDCNIYVRSERAGHRVKESVTRFIEKRLRLKVNEGKSAVARTIERAFVGFRIRTKPADPQIVEVYLSERSSNRVKARIRELTPRNGGRSLAHCIQRFNEYLCGWMGFFRIVSRGERNKAFTTWDSHIRRRFRAIILRHWKRRRTIARRLIKLGATPRAAWNRVYAKRSAIWALSHEIVVEHALSLEYFRQKGLISMVDLWDSHARDVVAPGGQLRLPLEQSRSSTGRRRGSKPVVPKSRM